MWHLIILLQVSEFSKEIDVAGLTHDPGGMFVIFNWDWVDVLDSELDQMVAVPLTPVPGALAAILSLLHLCQD